jgi:large subunit ribosomal protein L16
MCTTLLLQPRHFFFKRKQKMRSVLFFRSSAIKQASLLQFGGAGLLLLRPVQLTSIQVSRFKLFLKRASRKSDRTRRFTWFHAFPHLPLTRKANGTRMGKGKGKLECWFTNVSGGVTLIEFKNLRRGRASFFMRQMTHKLGVETKQLFSITDSKFGLPLGGSTRATFRVFW